MSLNKALHAEQYLKHGYTIEDGTASHRSFSDVRRRCGFATTYSVFSLYMWPGVLDILGPPKVLDLLRLALGIGRILECDGEVPRQEILLMGSIVRSPIFSSAYGGMADARDLKSCAL